jgi:hypothetical protein
MYVSEAKDDTKEEIENDNSAYEKAKSLFINSTVAEFG